MSQQGLTQQDSLHDAVLEVVGRHNDGLSQNGGLPQTGGWSEEGGLSKHGGVAQWRVVTMVLLEVP